MMQISDKEFELIRTLVYDQFGINLTEQKRSLVVGRLQKYLKSAGFDSFRSYYNYLTSDPTTQSLTDLINKISTNYSFFYREKAHFDFFVQTALPETLKKLKSCNSNNLRIWTAGCSTGEEPYMLEMLMTHHLGLEYSAWDAGILATDISERVLNFARDGIYPEERTNQVPASLKQKYFTLAGDGSMAVVEKIKKGVTFRRLNLMNRTFPFKKPFQMIFCRNVMIYFDKPTRDELVRRFHSNLIPGGYLFVGHSETLGRDQNLFQYLMPATYMKI